MTSSLFASLLLVAGPLGGIASAQDVATVFRYPVTSDGLDEGSPCSGSAYTISQCYDNSVNHDGIDFDYGCGDDVFAAGNGEVVHSAPSGDWGELIRIRHELPDGSEIYTQYAHLQERHKEVGDIVAHGDRIGLMGTTGYSSGCHLHFQVITEDVAGCGYYSAGSSCSSAWSSESDYWDTFLDPLAWLDDRLGAPSCETVTETIYADDAVAMGFVLADPDGENYDLHMYYREQSGSGSSKDGSYTLLDRGDMDAGYANPVIDDQARPDNYEKWLTGDVNDDGWTDVIFIAHASGDMKAQVWLANGDGSFQARDRWLSSSTQYDIYLHGARGKLIVGDDDGAGNVNWYTYNANDSKTAYRSSRRSWGRLGSSLDDVYVAGDFDGDNRTDLARGYVVSGAGTCPSDSSKSKLKWRVMEAGDDATSTWLEDWGCEGSDYLAGDFDGDGKDDLLQVRFDDSTTGKLIVALSDGSSFEGDGTWRDDFGDSGFRYYVHDVDGDGKDDVIDYEDDSDDRINVAYSQGSSFNSSNDRHASGVDRESKGEFLFGDFGELRLAIGEWSYEECE